MSKRQHTDILQPATPDHVELTRNVKEKIQELCGLYRRLNGMELQFPAELNQAVMRFVSLDQRFKEGDLRYKQSEIDGVKSLAEWTLMLNASLRNQPVPNIPDWSI